MSTPPRTCPDCDRQLRTRGEPMDDDRVVHQARGYCGNCYEVRRLRGQFELTPEELEQRRRTQLDTATLNARRKRLADLTTPPHPSKTAGMTAPTACRSTRSSSRTRTSSPQPVTPAQRARSHGPASRRP